jgi:hypothetical protein
MIRKEGVKDICRGIFQLCRWRVVEKPEAEFQRESRRIHGHIRTSMATREGKDRERVCLHICPESILPAMHNKQHIVLE